MAIFDPWEEKKKAETAFGIGVNGIKPVQSVQSFGQTSNMSTAPKMSAQQTIPPKTIASATKPWSPQDDIVAGYQNAIKNTGSMIPQTPPAPTITPTPVVPTAPSPTPTVDQTTPEWKRNNIVKPTLPAMPGYEWAQHPTTGEWIETQKNSDIYKKFGLNAPNSSTAAELPAYDYKAQQAKIESDLATEKQAIASKSSSILREQWKR